MFTVALCFVMFLFCEHASLFCLCCFCSWRQRYFAHIRHWVIPWQKNYPGTYLALEFVQGLTVTSWNGIWPTDKWSWHPSRFPFRTAARAAARKIKSLCQLCFLYERFCFFMINTHVKKMITPSFIFGFLQGYSGWELLINTLSEKVFQNSFWWSWGLQGFIFDVWPRLLGCQRLINTLIKKVLQNSFWWPWGLPGFIFEVWPGYLGWHFLLNNIIKKILRSSF